MTNFIKLVQRGNLISYQFQNENNNETNEVCDFKYFSLFDITKEVISLKKWNNITIDYCDDSPNNYAFFAECNGIKTGALVSHKEIEDLIKPKFKNESENLNIEILSIIISRVCERLEELNDLGMKQYEKLMCI